MKSPCSTLQHLLPLLLLASGCSIPSMDVTPRYGSFDIEGHFGISADPGPLPVADLNAAGFDKDDGYLGLRAEFDFGSTVLSVSTQMTSHGGEGVVDNDLGTSGRDEILAGTPVDSDMDLGLHQFLTTFDIVPTDFMDFGIGFGVTVIDLDAEIESAGDSLSAHRTLPLPVLALRGRVDLGDFEATLLLSGLDLSIDGDGATLLDIDLLAQYHLFGGDERLAGSIALGYRQTSLSVEYMDGADRIEADLRFNGPYLAMVFGF